jgi:hypothetical protein
MKRVNKMKKVMANAWMKRWLILFTAAVIAVLVLPWLGDSLVLHLGMYTAGAWVVVLVLGDITGKTPIFNGKHR